LEGYLVAVLAVTIAPSSDVMARFGGLERRKFFRLMGFTTIF
jgi:hypothetical protein